MLFNTSSPFLQHHSPSRYRDHHITSCCCAIATIPLFFLLRSHHAAIHSVAFQLPASEYIKDVDPRFAEPLRLNTMPPPPPPRTTRPRATMTPRHNILSLLSPPVDDGPFAAVPLRGSDAVAGGLPSTLRIARSSTASAATAITGAEETPAVPPIPMIVRAGLQLLNILPRELVLNTFVTHSLL